MKIKFTALLMFGVGLTSLKAQQVTDAAGGDASGSAGTVAYSVGQIVYTTQNSINGSVAQGVQQPYEISITTGLAEEGININLSVYPNPTTDWLTLKVDISNTLSDQPMLYQLFDISGKLLESNTIVANATTIKMEYYAVATYFLKVYTVGRDDRASVTQNNAEIKTFKIIKN
jgi:hypothetical protein